ncbi:protein SCAI [Dermatophagoides farinae]|nr:protein SCAI-like [Dermatophagoides farinae]
MHAIRYNRNVYPNSNKNFVIGNCFDYSRDSLLNDSHDYHHHHHHSIHYNPLQLLHQTTNMAVISEIEEHENKIVHEFCLLLEKSRQLFNGLRDLPPYGHKQWQPYFGRTFDVYTKLWKFQQQHRQILDSKYGLKRWQIGEIASKIGQLYYHYYLRTSETNYLTEAFSFYSAIRARGYYSKASKEERAELMVKKLRYYARFIVVCLLLKKMKLVRDLVRELDKQIDDYTLTYDPEDQLEWKLVLDEIRSFIEADNVLAVISMNKTPLILSHRMTPLNVPPMEKVMPSHLVLQEILIVGNCSDQVKFSELTLDMFRMLQALEREPQEDVNQMHDTSPAPGRIPNENGMDYRQFRRENPHKYLLFKPTFSQFLLFLSSGFKELPANGVLLIYLSADGCFINSKQPEDIGYDFGGVITNSKLRDNMDPNILKQRTSSSMVKEIHCLYPGDLYPFGRRPLFLIVDSDNSSAFQHIPRYFGQPLVILMSPEEYPAPFHDQQCKGSLFTLFLHCPITAICFISNIITLPIVLWEKTQQIIDRFFAEAGRLLVRSRLTDMAYIQFYSDDFLRLQMLRFIFCCVVLRMHRLFRVRRTYIPKSHPPIPDNDILDAPSLRRLILETSVLLDIRSLFTDNDDE